MPGSIGFAVNFSSSGSISLSSAALIALRSKPARAGMCGAGSGASRDGVDVPDVGSECSEGADDAESCSGIRGGKSSSAKPECACGLSWKNVVEAEGGREMF